MATAKPSAVFFASDDPRRLADFYREVLGLAPPEAKGDSLGMNSGSLHLGFEERGEKDRGPVTVWFDVDDVQTTLERIVERGGHVSSGPDSACSPGETLATACDVDGNHIGFIGPAASPSAHA